MKFSGLPNRAYNILFHTHTVSGIVISVALYIIFFAGAFTLFRDEFYKWENPTARYYTGKPIDYDTTLQKVKSVIPNFDWSDDTYLTTPSYTRPDIWVSGHIQTSSHQEEHFQGTYSPVNQAFSKELKTTTGETLYRLHFLDQLPGLGRYIAGFVSLFFLFATLTGVLIHWRNIVTKFYGFSLKGSWKQLWTNAHTVLGILGLPFQLLYAITGTFYILSILILLPTVLVFFGGDQQKVISAIRPNEGIVLKENAQTVSNHLSINQFVTKVQHEYPGFEINLIGLKHYKKEDAHITFMLKDAQSFTGDGLVSYSLIDGKKLIESMPGNKTYVQSVLFGIGRIHFGTFGGIIVKIIYFILALLTCFVLISGILIWKEARNKKEYTDQQKRFHHKVTMWYLAICFGLYPAIALLFISEQLIPFQLSNRITIVNSLFFGGWLAISICSYFYRTESRLTRFTLLMGGILSLAVPLSNSIVTGDWIGQALSTKQYTVLGVDLFWLLTGIVSLGIFSYLRKTEKRNNQLKPVKEIAR
ncbi:PepSY-associated TM helix domain-containing protein [Xanthocytophaga flava]|uniref:PepSY-associated TM helix domain-containing protein n=1 Tax=Xanthocytophaga flava TaxID=3048013 RepID=UPI0028D8B2B4|nr:PepSY-associated TM helix domain-containing protein [Xanthocytophaga flavus]MDJ1469311.1 PepSY-associated TM helix domain-containing protein [Xanthocytophaga flavus]